MWVILQANVKITLLSYFLLFYIGLFGLIKWIHLSLLSSHYPAWWALKSCEFTGRLFFCNQIVFTKCFSQAILLNLLNNLELLSFAPFAVHFCHDSLSLIVLKWFSILVQSFKGLRHWMMIRLRKNSTIHFQNHIGIISVSGLIRQKTEPTKTKRIARAVNALSKKWRYPEMLRANKKFTWELYGLS